MKQAKATEVTLLRGEEKRMSWTDAMMMMESETMDVIEMVTLDDGEVVVGGAESGRTGEIDDVRELQTPD